MSKKLKNPMLFYAVAIAIVVGVGLFLYLLSNSQQKRDEVDNKTVIATSIFPVATIAESIGGEEIEIVQIVPSGASPHTFEPTIESKAKLARADRVYVIGLGFDDWVNDLIESDQEIIDLSNYVNLLENEHPHDHDHEEGDDDDDHGGEEDDHDGDDNDHGNAPETERDAENQGNYDPHYWLSPENAKLIAAKISKDLSSDNPESSDLYKNNLAEFENEMDELVKYGASKLEESQNKELITLHHAFAYFADTFGLEIVATVEPVPGKEISPQDREKLYEELEAHDIRTVYSEPQLSQNWVKSLQEDFAVEVEVLDPLGGIDGRDSYSEIIRYNINQIAE